MEKKNTILLTVIAIATLLVAVVGATFAYFTAQVTSDKADNNNQTNVTTAAFASAEMAMGDKVTETDVAPGAKVIKVVEVKGTCPSTATDGTCTAAKADVKITETIPTEFGTDVTWKLYKSTDITNPDKTADDYVPEKVTCTQTLKAASLDATTNKYYTVSKCEKGDAAKTVVFDSTGDTTIDNIASLGSEVTLVDNDGAKVYTDTVEGGKTHYFYLVVDYANRDAVQDQQGLNFTIDIDFVPSATINLPAGS